MVVLMAWLPLLEPALCEVDAAEVWEMLADAGEVSGPGVAWPRDSELEPDAEAGAVADAALVDGLAMLLEAAEDEAAFPLLQVRLYKGALLRSEPTMPKDGLGVVGSASCSVYHHVLVLPSTAQATSCQYVSAFWTEATARFS